MKEFFLRWGVPLLGLLVGLLVSVGLLAVRVVALQREVEEARVLADLSPEQRSARARLSDILEEWGDGLIATRADLADRIMEWREHEAPLCVDAE